jgi:hypothetical protein
MQITFRGGAQIEVDVDSFEVGRSKVTDAVVSLKWETPAGWNRKLNTLSSLDEIVAIVAIEDRSAVEPAAVKEASDG